MTPALCSASYLSASNSGTGRAACHRCRPRGWFCSRACFVQLRCASAEPGSCWRVRHLLQVCCLGRDSLCWRGVTWARAA